MGLRDDQYKSQINGSKTKKKFYPNKTTLKSNKKSIFQKTSKKNNLSNPKYWVLPNRKKFIEWIDNQFDLFKYSNRSKLQESDFFPHQQLIKNYLQMDSPSTNLTTMETRKNVVKRNLLVARMTNQK